MRAHSSIRIVALLMAAVGLAAGVPALALEPLHCPGDGSGPEGWLDGYMYRAVTHEFVYYESTMTANGRPVAILEHCPSRQQLFLTLSVPGMSAGLRQNVETMIWGPASLTLDEMAGALRAYPEVHAEVVRADYRSCACRVQADPARALTPELN